MAEIGSPLRRFSAKPLCAPSAQMVFAQSAWDEVVELERRGPRLQRKDRRDPLLRPVDSAFIQMESGQSGRQI